MSIKIDKRSKHSAYITVGNITIYVEHSPRCAEEYISIWKENPYQETIFKSYFDFDKNKNVIEVTK
jgi:hypothetical protein